MAIRLLAVSIVSGRVGFVVFDGDQPTDWGLSKKAAQSPDDLADVLSKWLTKYRPLAVVSEQLTPGTRKRGKTIELIAALASHLASAELLHVRIVRERPYKNKYIEADRIVARFPDLAPWKPVREHFYDNEPANTVIFEAIALALQVRRDPTRYLAKAMG